MSNTGLKLHEMFSYLDFPDNLDEKTTFTHNSETIIKFTTRAAKSCIAYLHLILEKKSEQTSLRNHCIEVASNSTPVIHNCRITSKNNCKSLRYKEKKKTPKRFSCSLTCFMLFLFVTSYELI